MVMTGSAGEISWGWRPKRAWKVRSEKCKSHTKVQASYI